jgi:hypothetical protein
MSSWPPKGRANYENELKDRLKTRSVRVKMLADGNIAAHLWGYRLIPKGSCRNGTSLG